ncbi:MAG: nuclear transport factor 2 family protein [Terracidiphilus sp.]
MNLTRWMNRNPAGARLSSLAIQTEVAEAAKRKDMWTMNGILILTIVGLLIAPFAKAQAAGDAKPAAGPTADSVWAAEVELARALQNNDVDGIARCLSDDWAVISARGGVAEGKSIFPEGIKQGYLTRKAYEVSEPRVHLYGNVALVTAKVHTSGTFGGKPFDVMERATDVWIWKDGSWKCVLSHETKEGA